MRSRWVGTLLVGGLVALGACSSERDSQLSSGSTGAPQSAAPTTTVVTTDPMTTSETSAATATSAAPETTSTPATTTSATTPTSVPRGSTTTTEPRRTTSTTTPRSTTTTIAPLPAGVHNPRCVVRIGQGDSLSLIADRVANEAVTVRSLQVENEITDPDAIEAGDLLDTCVRNRVNDITGDRRVRRRPTPPPTTSTPGGSGVEAQQVKLNELFAGTGMPALAVDGYSGPFTQQQLCAARVVLGMPVSRADVVPGSPEEQSLMAAGSLAIPSSAPVWASRWALIDQRCQVMFIGEAASRLVYVFQTSTGELGHETPEQGDSRVFRYDPARENDGWHDSVDYPVAIDNPLNGNMYKPLYFDGGRAIHGANNVPPDPQSKGCARLHVEHQELLVNWMGLGDVAEPIWDTGPIDLTVTVQGTY